MYLWVVQGSSRFKWLGIENLHPKSLSRVEFVAVRILKNFSAMMTRTFIDLHISAGVKTVKTHMTTVSEWIRFMIGKVEYELP